MSCPSTTSELTSPVPDASPLRRLWSGLGRLAGSQLLRKSGLSVLDQAVVSGTSFVTSVVLGRCILREELGVYYLALSIVFFARGIQEQLVSAPYMIYYGRKPQEQLAEYAGSALVHQCVLLAITAALVFMAALAGWSPRGGEAAFWLLAVAAPVLLLREFIRQLCFAHLDLKAALALDAAAAAMQLGAMALLALTGRLNVATTLSAFTLASGAPAVVWLAVQRRPMLGRWRAAVRDFATNWLFARWALASQLLASTTPYVMPWIVAWTHGESNMGLLGACTTLVGLSNTFLMGLCNFLSPRAAHAFAAGGLAELRHVLRNTALLFVGTLGTLSLVAWMFGEQLAIAVYGPQFVGAGPIIGVLSLSVLANSLGITAGNGLWALERPSANFVADLCSLGAVVGVSCVCVPLWGPLGAALATLAGTATDATVRVWILRATIREFSGLEPLAAEVGA